MSDAFLHPEEADKKRRGNDIIAQFYAFICDKITVLGEGMTVADLIEDKWQNEEEQGDTWRKYVVPFLKICCIFQKMAA